MKIFKPEVFQGNSRKRRYFEGWYLKHVSSDMEYVYSFIPGISYVSNDPHAFIQIINGITGETFYIRYDVDEFTWDPSIFKVKIGASEFSSTHSSVKIINEKVHAEGFIKYKNQVRYPSSLFSPGIMGWYSFVPFMECKHAVVSVNHFTEGKLQINGKQINYNQGKGYIEKDWGTSFPAAWLWVQTNNFQNQSASFMLSLAKIPWLGSYFVGLICFLHVNDIFFLFNTYKGSKIKNLYYDDRIVRLEIQNRNGLLMVDIERRKDGELLAPREGEMRRIIKESVDSVCRVKLFDQNGNLVFNEKGERAGLEITSNIFDLLEKEVKENK